MRTPESDRYIKIPADWDEAKDRHEFERRFGPVEDYRREAAERLNHAYVEFNGALDRAVAWFTRGLEITALIGPSLTVQEKIDWLTSLVMDVVTEDRLRDRLLEDLAFCAWAEHERHRLLHAVRHPFAIVWVATFCQLLDALSTARLRLEESLLRCGRLGGAEGSGAGGITLAA